MESVTRPRRGRSSSPTRKKRRPKSPDKNSLTVDTIRSQRKDIKFIRAKKVAVSPTKRSSSKFTRKIVERNLKSPKKKPLGKSKSRKHEESALVLDILSCDSVEDVIELTSPSKRVIRARVEPTSSSKKSKLKSKKITAKSELHPEQPTKKTKRHLDASAGLLGASFEPLVDTDVKPEKLIDRSKSLQKRNKQAAARVIKTKTKTKPKPDTTVSVSIRKRDTTSKTVKSEKLVNKAKVTKAEVVEAAEYDEFKSQEEAAIEITHHHAEADSGREQVVEIGFGRREVIEIAFYEEAKSQEEDLVDPDVSHVESKTECEVEGKRIEARGSQGADTVLQEEKVYEELEEKESKVSDGSDESSGSESSHSDSEHSRVSGSSSENESDSESYRGSGSDGSESSEESESSEDEVLNPIIEMVEEEEVEVEAEDVQETELLRIATAESEEVANILAEMILNVERMQQCAPETDESTVDVDVSESKLHQPSQLELFYIRRKNKMKRMTAKRLMNAKLEKQQAIQDLKKQSNHEQEQAQQHVQNKKLRLQKGKQYLQVIREKNKQQRLTSKASQRQQKLDIISKLEKQKAEKQQYLEKVRTARLEKEKLAKAEKDSIKLKEHYERPTAQNDPLFEVDFMKKFIGCRY